MAKGQQYQVTYRVGNRQAVTTVTVKPATMSRAFGDITGRAQKIILGAILGELPIGAEVIMAEAV